MHLSILYPTPQVGWSNAGDLTKSSVKFPSAGAKKLVTTPPHKKGFYREFDLGIKIIFDSVCIIFCLWLLNMPNLVSKCPTHICLLELTIFTNNQII